MLTISKFFCSIILCINRFVVNLLHYSNDFESVVLVDNSVFLWPILLTVLDCLNTNLLIDQLTPRFTGNMKRTIKNLALA